MILRLTDYCEEELLGKNNQSNNYFSFFRCYGIAPSTYLMLANR